MSRRFKDAWNLLYAFQRADEELTYAREEYKSAADRLEKEVKARNELEACMLTMLDHAGLDAIRTTDVIYEIGETPEGRYVAKRPWPKYAHEIKELPPQLREPDPVGQVNGRPVVAAEASTA